MSRVLGKGGGYFGEKKGVNRKEKKRQGKGFLLFGLYFHLFLSSPIFKFDTGDVICSEYIIDVKCNRVFHHFGGVLFHQSFYCENI